jgi:hypothetical protein
VGPELTSAPGSLELVAQRQLDSVFVHGDVFVENVTWVYLSLRDASGRIAGWGSVSAPGGVGPRDGDGPTMRFDLQLAAPDASFPDALTLTATAYGDGGDAVASASIEGLARMFAVAAAGGADGVEPGWMRPTITVAPLAG